MIAGATQRPFEEREIVRCTLHPDFLLRETPPSGQVLCESTPATLVCGF